MGGRTAASLVTDDGGNLIDRVWYDPFGGIISHTLPLTLTDRLFTGGRRESTIQLYDLGQWYDPYTARYLLPDDAMPVALPGLSPYAADYGAAGGRPAELSLLDALGTSAAKATIGAGIEGVTKIALRRAYLSACDYVPVRVAKRLEKVVRHTRDFPAGRALASLVRLWPGTKPKMLAQGIDDALDIAGIVLPRETIEVSFKYAYVWMRQEPVGLPRLAKDLAKGELLDLGIGLAIDVGYQALLDKPLRDAGYLTPGQYWGRLGVEAVGSAISWRLGIVGGSAVGTAVAGPPGTVVGGVIGGIAGFVVEVAADTLYDQYATPWIYEILGLYPADPMEPLSR